MLTKDEMNEIAQDSQRDKNTIACLRAEIQHMRQQYEWIKQELVNEKVANARLCDEVKSLIDRLNLQTEKVEVNRLLDATPEENVDVVDLLSLRARLEEIDKKIKSCNASSEEDEKESFFGHVNSAIENDAQFSYRYAIGVLKGPFPAGEPAIATHPWYSYQYALRVLRGPFPAGEPAIATDAEYSKQYVRDVIDGDWSRFNQNADR